MVAPPQRSTFFMPLLIFLRKTHDFALTQIHKKNKEKHSFTTQALIGKAIQNVSEAAWLLFYRCRFPYSINKELDTKCLLRSLAPFPLIFLFN